MDTLRAATSVNRGVIPPRILSLIGQLLHDGRWRPQFRLRTLLFVVMPIAAGFMWFYAAYRSGVVERDAAMWVHNQNGHVSYDFETPDSDGSYPTDLRLPATKFLRDLLGIEFFSNVRCVILDNKFVDDLSPLAKFRDLRVLAICIDILPETDLAPIAELSTLEMLTIDYTSITLKQSAEIEMLRKALPKCKIALGPNVVANR